MADRPTRRIILAPTHIDDRGAMKRADRLVKERLSDEGLSAALLARTAFATLVDNGLTHADAGGGPVAAVYLDDRFVTVTSRDRGQRIAASTDPKLELMRRIQIPAEDAGPAPGAPAGLPWLARLLTMRCRGGRLEFIAGEGRLTFDGGVWTCRQGLAVDGFAALARLPVV